MSGRVEVVFDKDKLTTLYLGKSNGVDSLTRILVSDLSNQMGRGRSVIVNLLSDQDSDGRASFPSLFLLYSLKMYISKL